MIDDFMVLFVRFNGSPPQSGIPGQNAPRDGRNLSQMTNIFARRRSAVIKRRVEAMLGKSAEICVICGTMMNRFGSKSLVPLAASLFVSLAAADVEDFNAINGA